MVRLLLFALALTGLALASDVKIDNEYVRVLFANEVPHQPTPLHQHDFNRVIVYIDAGDMQIRHEDGKIDRPHYTAGQVNWSPAGGKHVSENVGVHALRMVEVEVKRPASHQQFRLSPRDPLKLDQTHYTLLFENDQVRVFRSKFPAGSREPTHEHLSSGRISIPLVDIDATVYTEGESPRQTSLKIGDAIWSAGRVVHSFQTVRDAEMVIVELK